MTILDILRALFKSRPSLEEFVEMHNPTSVYQVEQLEKQYARMISSSKFWG